MNVCMYVLDTYLDKVIRNEVGWLVSMCGCFCKGAKFTNPPKRKYIPSIP